MKEKIEGILRQVQATGQLITYEQLGHRVGLEPISPVLWAALGDISADTWESEGILLSALVVNKADGFPGKQFFTEVAKPRVRFRDRLKFWCAHVRKIHQRAKATA